VSDAEFLHTLTPAESDALEEMGEPDAYAAISLLELLSRRLREAGARRAS
jgi:hypothetical protein